MYNFHFASDFEIIIISYIEKFFFKNEAYSLLDLQDMNKNNKYVIITCFENQYIIIGYIIFYINLDFIDIFKIYVDENFRRKKIGNKLLAFVNETAVNNNIYKILLEVRENNVVAINFYKNNDFKFVAKRNNYYTNPKDNAIVMEKHLGG